MLSVQDSAVERDRLIGELERLSSPEDAADWVHEKLSVKNTLDPADADRVEARFREMMAIIGPGEPASSGAPRVQAGDTGVTLSVVDPIEWAKAAPNALELEPGLRRRLVASKAIRLRDAEHCRYVSKQPCVVCGRLPGEAHHLRFAQPRALGRKVSDEYTVPMCRLHHRELHRYGDEVSWWVGVNVDPLPIARELWKRSRSQRIGAPEEARLGQ
jgi:hypothetical protein